MLPAAARRRPASVALAALIACTFLFVLFGLFLWIGVVRVAKAEGTRAADAAAIAAAVRLADNRVLTGDTTVLTDADAAARAVAAPNLIYGRPPDIAAYVNNAPTGDVLFGTVDPTQPHGSRFTAGPNPIATPAQLAAVNAVRVRTNGTVGGCPNDDGTVCGGRRIGPTAVAWFDTGVFGFRPVNLPNPPTAADPRTPVLPVALFQEDATVVAGTPFSWSELGTIPVGGPVPTVDVVLGPPTPGSPPVGDGTVVQGAFLSVGAGGAFANFLNQVNTGITGADLTGAPYNGRFALALPTNTLDVPGQTVPPVPNAALASAFNLRLNQTVVFPLYPQEIADGTSPTGFVLRLTGFVSARVTAVGVSAASGQVQLTLTPFRFQTPSALTDPARYNPDTRTYQPVVGRVRIAE